MAKVKYRQNLSIEGVLNLNEDKVIVEIEEKGSQELADLLTYFNGKPIKITVTSSSEIM